MRHVSAARYGCLFLMLGAFALAGCATEETTGGSEPPPAAEESEDDTDDAVSSDVDTGRMSEGEYDEFVRVHGELIDEAAQWTGELPTCSTIGLSGDLAGFRDCLKEAWSGFEDAALVAYGYADDTLGDVAKTCVKRLRAYRNQTDRFYSVSLNAHEVADSLDFDAFGPAFNQLPRVSNRWVNVSERVLADCSPQ